MKREAAIADTVLFIEAELRGLGLWESTPPTEAALASPHPFCFDTLKLHQWLQWVFIPKVLNLLEAGDPLPEHSDIFPLAEEYFAPLGPGANRLVILIRRFDELINADAATLAYLERFQANRG